MSGHAPLGGPRELALACFVVCRLVADARQPGLQLSAEQRRARAQGTKHWLASATIPAPVRSALGKVAEAVAAGKNGEIEDALRSVIIVTATRLDSSARLELARLAQGIAQ